MYSWRYTMKGEPFPFIAAIRWSRSSKARFLCRSATGSLLGVFAGAGVRGDLPWFPAILSSPAGPVPPLSRRARSAGKK